MSEPAGVEVENREVVFTTIDGILVDPFTLRELAWAFGMTELQAWLWVRYFDRRGCQVARIRVKSGPWEVIR